VLTVRQALGGPWAANLPGWAILFLPSTIWVFLLNAGMSGMTSTEVLLVAVVEHLAAGIVALAVGALFRKRYPVFPLPLSFALWAMVGGARGASGALLLALWSTEDPLYEWRVGFWIIVAFVWMPLFVFLAAQWQQQVRLAATKSLLEALRDEERKHSIEPAAQVHKRLISSVQSAISPVVDEIRRSLEAVSNGIDPAAMRRIGDQLAAVANEAAAIVSGKLDSHSIRPHPPQVRRTSALIAAINFELERPILASTITGLTLATIMIPIGFTNGGIFGLVAAITGTGTTTTALLLRALLTVNIKPQTSKFRGFVVLFSYSIAGVFGSITVAAMSSGALSDVGVVLVFVFPFATVLTSSLIAATVGLSGANQSLTSTITDLDNERHDLEIITQVTEDRVRKDLATLMHGPVQGRLSACVMALNFHAAELEQGNPDLVASVTRAVLEHLEAASSDLDSLGITVLADARP
jgi:hypothetical protein